MKQKNLLTDYKTKAVGADVTSVRCNGKWAQFGVSVDAVNGMVLSIDPLSGEDAEQLKAWLEPILDAVDAGVLVTMKLGVRNRFAKAMSEEILTRWLRNSQL